MSGTPSSPAAAAPGEAAVPDPNRWAALAVLLTGAFLTPLDFFIVNVALPSITADLDARAADVQLVMSGYAVMFAVFLITGGRLGDIFGRKAVFLAGLTGFALSSALCGLAWSPAVLIVARLLQGLAAAALAPQALASVHALFPAHERARALGIYGVTLGLSSAVGQVAGGVLVAADVAGLGWRLVFLINLPIAVTAFAAAIPLLRESLAASRPRLDLIGVALSSVTLAAFVVPLVEGRERGWPWWSFAALGATPFLAELFRRYERHLARAGGDPLVAFEVFRQPGLVRGLGAILALYAMATFFMVYALYLQAGLGFTPLASGLAVVPFSVGFVLASTFSPVLGRWFGRAAPSAGFVASATGGGVLSLTAASIPAGTVPPWYVMGGALVLLGVGIGMALPTLMRVIVERVEPHRAGLVGGMVNSTLQVSAAMAMAIFGGLFFNVLGSDINPATVARAFAVSLVAMSLVHVAGAALAAGLGERHARQSRRHRRPARARS